MPYTRTIEKTIYTFEDVMKDESLKQKVLNNLWDLNVDHEWWAATYEDALNIDLKITGFCIDPGSYCGVAFVYGPECTAKLIIENHGKQCKSFSAAINYQAALKLLEDNAEKDEDGCIVDLWDFDEQRNDLEKEFINDLSHYYLTCLRSSYEYLTEEKTVLETIEANGYEFDEDGEIV